MADRERDENTGQFTDKYPREEILTVIEDLSGTAATSEIADALDADRNAIYKKLRLMEDDEQVVSRKAGGIRVWSTVDDST
ncbi:MAG: transcriptional regulator, partial [Halobacteriaceae archaeon]